MRLLIWFQRLGLHNWYMLFHPAPADATPSAPHTVGSSRRYHILAIASDHIGEAEYIRMLAEQVVGTHIHHVIENNKPARDPIINVDIAAIQVQRAGWKFGQRDAIFSQLST